VLLASALLAGCAVDPIEKLQDKLDSQRLAERRAAVRALETLKDERSVELLVETMGSDPDLLEQAGNALVLKGRKWEQKHPKAKKSEQNPVIEHLSQTVGDMHLDAAVRAKACWVLGEIGSRRALPAIKGRKDDPNSMIVRAEYATALSKLGSADPAAAMEMLPDGTLVKTYDPKKRGLVVKEEEGKAKASKEGETEAETGAEEKAGASTGEAGTTGGKTTAAAGKAAGAGKAPPLARPEAKTPAKPSTRKT
jgi:HEAT repeat protein